MYETTFRSEDLGPADRADGWRQHVSQLVPVGVSVDDTAALQVSARALSLGPVQLIRLRMPPMRWHRPPSMVRQCDPELYQVVFPHSGRLGVSWSGSDHESSHTAQDVVIQDTSIPGTNHMTADPGHSAYWGTAILVPKALMPFPAHRVGALAHCRISAREGMGALLAQTVSRIAADASTYRQADGPRLGRAVADLLAALLAHELDADRDLSPDTHRQALTSRIQAFIQQHLNDPDLTPGTIAAAHSISRSYLHRLFQGQGTTVTAWIRQQRLEHVRNNLSDPALCAVPIHAIAARWGFSSAANFTRAFRAAYGVPPKDYRAMWMSGLGELSGR
ncbi:AraC family transcriptional regulator [Streptomyces sp. NPDC059850]|uniref:AraC family transcriptional regulator n=1 Tax=Streptomyces sp. NPDC059850 TaxID=3346970 RepID=UPI00366920FA